MPKPYYISRERDGNNTTIPDKIITETQNATEKALAQKNYAKGGG